MRGCPSGSPSSNAGLGANNRAFDWFTATARAPDPTHPSAKGCKTLISERVLWALPPRRNLIVCTRGASRSLRKARFSESSRTVVGLVILKYGTAPTCTARLGGLKKAADARQNRFANPLYNSPGITANLGRGAMEMTLSSASSGVPQPSETRSSGPSKSASNTVRRPLGSQPDTRCCTRGRDSRRREDWG